MQTDRPQGPRDAGEKYSQEKTSKPDAPKKDDLDGLVYGELRRLAAHCMNDERANHTLTPTALVHEVYLRLIGKKVDDEAYQTQSHFFSTAAVAMRHVLVDAARKKRALKRGGDKVFVTIDEGLVGETQRQDIEVLSDALSELERQHPDLSELVSLRYFGGMSMRQAAAAMEMPLRTAERNWHFARAWLKTELSK